MLFYRKEREKALTVVSMASGGTAAAASAFFFSFALALAVTERTAVATWIYINMQQWEAEGRKGGGEGGGEKLKSLRLRHITPHQYCWFSKNFRRCLNLMDTHVQNLKHAGNLYAKILVSGGYLKRFCLWLPFLSVFLSPSWVGRGRRRGMDGRWNGTPVLASAVRGEGGWNVKQRKKGVFIFDVKHDTILRNNLRMQNVYVE